MKKLLVLSCVLGLKNDLAQRRGLIMGYGDNHLNHRCPECGIIGPCPHDVQDPPRTQKVPEVEAFFEKPSRFCEVPGCLEVKVQGGEFCIGHGRVRVPAGTRETPLSLRTRIGKAVLRAETSRLLARGVVAKGQFKTWEELDDQGRQDYIDDALAAIMEVRVPVQREIVADEIIQELAATTGGPDWALPPPTLAWIRATILRVLETNLLDVKPESPDRIGSVLRVDPQDLDQDPTHTARRLAAMIERFGTKGDLKTLEIRHLQDDSTGEHLWVMKSNPKV